MAAAWFRRSELAALVQAMLAQLSPTSREVLALHDEVAQPLTYPAAIDSRGPRLLLCGPVQPAPEAETRRLSRQIPAQPITEGTPHDQLLVTPL